MTEKFIKLIEAEIKKHPFGHEPKSLYEPIRYIMSLGGKRLRPLLVQHSYALYKSDVETITTYAMAVEAFHNFTLMHDDIMDNAPLRRGKITVHEKWNVNTAILSGDVMLVKVYDLFLSLPQEKLAKVLGAFNKCAAEVCEGQQWDMVFETKKRVSEADYIEMIKLKTAVLLGFSLELGAILADAPEEDCKALRDFGTNIGIGFQLTDDWLDVYADAKKFGKQVGGDIISNKKTFLLIKALEKARGAQKKELQDWIEKKKFNKVQKVKAVTRIYDHLRLNEFVSASIANYFNLGFASLEKVKVSSEKKETLKNYTKQLIDRVS